MKRIKTINGYAIYQSMTQRDVDNYGCQIGNYNVYVAQDIRDYGLTNSYANFDDIDSLATAIELASGSNYAAACALADELSDSTIQDMDLVIEIERRLDSGDSIEYVRDSYDMETGRLYETPSEAEAARDDAALADGPEGDLEDMFEEVLSANDRESRNLDYDPEETELLCRAMRAAGLIYDGLDSSDGFIVFDDWNTCFRQSYASWPEVREWLEGVVFYDTDVSDAVERILHPERFASQEHLPYTSQEEFRALRDGDVFYDFFGLEHIAAGDAHPSGDASCDEWIVYDTDGDSYFESEFAGPGQPGSRIDRDDLQDYLDRNYEDPNEVFYTSINLETGTLLQELIAGRASYDTIDEIENYGLWGMAVLELGHADIEVNVTHEGDHLIAEYFVCLKDSVGDWHSWGYIDRLVTIDWSSPDWRELLKQEMRLELRRYARGREWSIDAPMDSVIDGLYACPGQDTDDGPEPEPAPVEESKPRSHASYIVLRDPDDGSYTTVCPRRMEGWTDDDYKNAIVVEAARHYAFNDCGGLEPVEIVVDGHHVEYAGWKPGMRYVFSDCETGEIVFDECFPEWDH